MLKETKVRKIIFIFIHKKVDKTKCLYILFSLIILTDSMDFRDFDFDDLLEALSSGNVFLVSSSYRKDSKCRCGRCPKPPQEPTIPDVASLIDEVLSNAGIRRPVATPMKYPRNTVTIFDGPFTGFFGILYELQSSRYIKLDNS